MKYIIGLVSLVVVVYNAIYLRPLDEKLAENQVEAFDAPGFVSSIWQKDLLPVYQSASDLTALLAGLKQNPKTVFESEGHALGIGNIGYFRVKGIGVVDQINENNVLIQVNDHPVEIETEFIFGNAVRDASGLIAVNDYDETSDFNSISEAINTKIREQIIPPFKANVKPGDSVLFQGAIQLNKAHLHLEDIEVIPVSIQIHQ